MPQNLQLQCQYCNDSHCTVTVTWSPPENEDCITFYDIMVTLDNTTDHTSAAFLVAAKSSQTAYNYSHTAVLPRGSYNATATAENICGKRSETSKTTLTASKMTCAMNVCPTCGGTNSCANTLLWPAILTALLSAILPCLYRL